LDELPMRTNEIGDSCILLVEPGERLRISHGAKLPVAADSFPALRDRCG
jgi:hypothetical protein